MSRDTRGATPRGPRTPAASALPAAEVGEATLYLRALELLNGAAIVVDRSLRVVGATRAAERILGPLEGGHIVRVLGGAADPSIANAFSSDHAVVLTVAAGDPAREQRARVRAMPLRDGPRHVGWVVRVVLEPTGAGQAEHFESMWTGDDAVKRAFAIAQLLAECDVSVVISGEMGVGKASLAAAIHARSARRAQPLRVLSCAALTPEVLEHQLLGRVPGEEAASTLVLDEVAELPHEAQGTLLRVLESGVVTPIDGGTPVVVDVRTIATTRASLDREVELGNFRADLLMRLRTVSLEVPPLRARPADIPLLTEKFVAELNAQGARQITKLSEDALARLQRHAWPGNVRELRVAIEAAFATGRGPTLVAADLPPQLSATVDGPPRAMADAAPGTPVTDEASRVKRALERAGGDRTRAAAILGVSRTTLWRRMRALNLEEA